MLPSIFIGLLFGAGFGAWVYSKTMRQTGSNTQTSLIVAAVAGFIALLIIVTIFSFIPS